MPFQSKHLTDAPDRSTVDTLPGATLLEFGTAWCGHCQGAQPLIAQALEAAPQVAHIKVEDGPGRALGRSYRVKLWRSEERRVGKECRSRWSACHSKKKTYVTE